MYDKLTRARLHHWEHRGGGASTSGGAGGAAAPESIATAGLPWDDTSLPWSPKTKSCQHAHVKGVNDSRLLEVAPETRESTRDVKFELIEQSPPEEHTYTYSLDTARSAADKVVGFSNSEYVTRTRSHRACWRNTKGSSSHSATFWGSIDAWKRHQCIFHRGKHAQRTEAGTFGSTNAE